MTQQYVVTKRQVIIHRWTIEAETAAEAQRIAADMGEAQADELSDREPTYSTEKARTPSRYSLAGGAR